MKKLLLIDSNAIIHRAYHALPKTMSTRKGEQTNAIYGFATTLIKMLEDLHPDYVVASFDVSKKTFRTEQYAEYKATRVKADQELYDQIPRVKELLSVFSIPICEKEGYEADDCIGTIVNKVQATDNSIQSYIVTGDKDLFQLLNGEVFVYWLKKGLSEASIVGSKEIKKIFNLDPEDFIDLKALAGDASDNIPGVPGIGPKTATTLIQRFDTLNKLYDSIETVIPAPMDYRGKRSAGIQALDPRVKPEDDKMGTEDDKLINAAKELDIKPRILQLLIKYKKQAFLSQSLATIHKEVPIDFDLRDAKWGQYDREKARELFEELGFHSLLKRFGVEEAAEKKTERAKEREEKDKQLKLL